MMTQRLTHDRVLRITVSPFTWRDTLSRVCDVLYDMLLIFGMVASVHLAILPMFLR